MREKFNLKFYPPKIITFRKFLQSGAYEVGADPCQTSFWNPHATVPLTYPALVHCLIENDTEMVLSMVVRSNRKNIIGFY